MQSKMFVFIGLLAEAPGGNLENLLDKLNNKFSKTNPKYEFTKKDNLISARIDDVPFYISFLNEIDEMDDWIQMAKDFELSIELNQLNKEILTKRYEKVKSLLPDLYSINHYSVAKDIFEEMSTYPAIKIYSFQ